jgi:hypothetical protein
MRRIDIRIDLICVISGVLANANCVAAAAESCDASIPTFADGLTPTSFIHVATDGSDGAGDGTPQNPYASIDFAIDQASPGTSVVIHAGTYPGGNFVNAPTGTPSAPIWVGGAAGEPRPIINGGSTGFQISRAKYFILHDLEVQNAAQNGINFDDGGDVENDLAAHHLICHNLSIHDIGGTGNQDGLKLSGIRDYWVLECDFARTGGGGSGSGIDHVGCHRGVIARCEFNDMSGNAFQIKGGSTDIEVRWCRITNGGQRAFNIGGSTGFQFFRPPLSTTEPNAEARNIRVVANIIQGATAAIGYVGAENCAVANNTIITPENWIFRILQETTTSGQFEFVPCRNNAFVGNLVYFDRSELSTYVNIGPNTAPETFNFANNLWYAYDNPAQSTPTLPATESNAIYAQDPLLADPGAGDFRIFEDSPAIAAGLEPPPIPTDIQSTCYNDPAAIGAYETPAPGDIDANGKINLFDFALFTDCAEGPNQPVTLPCARADFDTDTDVDAHDFAPFQRCFAP